MAVQRIIYNNDNSKQAQDKARAKLSKFREALTATIDKYKSEARYKSLDKKHKKKILTEPNHPKHVRLKDVEELESIIKNAKTAHELETNVLNYTNGKDKFKGLGHLSRLRTRLNAALKKFVANNKLKDIDRCLNLFKEVQPENLIINAEVPPAEQTEEQDSPLPPPPNDAEPVVIATLQPTPANNTAMQAELARVKKQLHAKEHTLNEQTEANKKLLAQIEVRDQHLAAANTTLAAHKQAITALQQEANELAAAHQAYVTNTETVITTMKAAFDKVKNLLRQVTRTNTNDNEKKSQKSLLGKMKGMMEKFKLNTKAKAKIIEIKAQMKNKNGEIYDLLSKGQVEKNKDMTSTNTAQLKTQLAAKKKVEQLSKVIAATSEIKKIEPSKDLPALVNADILSKPVPPPFIMSDSEEESPPALLPRDDHLIVNDDDNNNAPPPPAAEKQPSCAKTTGTMFAPKLPCEAALAAATATLKKSQEQAEVKKDKEEDNTLLSALKTRFVGMRVSIAGNESEDEDEDWSLKL